jgi:tetratricopeptide (TPR) repeat protein
MPLSQRIVAAFAVGVVLAVLAGLGLRIAGAGGGADTAVAAALTAVCLTVGLGGIDALAQRLGRKGSRPGARSDTAEDVSKRLKALADKELVQVALDFFSAEIDSDESVSVALKRLIVAGLVEAAEQLLDPQAAAKGREALRGFVVNLVVHRPQLEAGLSPREGPLADETLKPGGQVNAGVEFERRGDLKAAEAAYRRADAEGNVNGAVRLGVLLERRGQREAAESAYRRADLLGSAAGAARLGALLESRGDLPGAEAAYSRADARGSPAGSRGLASVHERRGEVEQADAAYQRAAERTRTLQPV